MSAACTHSKHRTDKIPYRISKDQKVSVSVDEGWNDVHHRWEMCDNGLFQKNKITKTRRHPHSIPRTSKYRVKKATSSNEMS